MTMNFSPELKSCFLSIAEGTLLERLPLPDLIPVIGYHFDWEVLEKLKRKAWIDLGQYGCVDCYEELELYREELEGLTRSTKVVEYMQDLGCWNNECICFDICYDHSKRRMSFESQYISSFCPLCIKQWEQIIEYDKILNSNE